MFVTTAMVGDSLRKLPSLSSASATRNSPCPSLAFVPRLFSLPPMTTVGSMLPAASTVATIEVVVVLPCAPAMATPYLSRMSSASISARGITGICFSLAATTSTLSFFTADEMTTTCGEATFSARCPIKISPPSFLSRSVVSDAFMSEPETRYPRLSRTSAIPLMPIPPMPTKWICLIFLNIGLADPHNLPGGAGLHAGGGCPALFNIFSDHGGKDIGAQVFLDDHLCHDPGRQRPRIILLMVVRCKRKRNEHRRLPADRELGNGGRAGTRND